MSLESVSSLPVNVSPILERRDGSKRILGHLTALDGTKGVIANDLTQEFVSHQCAIGHLITIVNGKSRIVGVVSRVDTASGFWRADECNQIRIEVEIAGEIIDDEGGKPYFYKGIRDYPPLGSIAHKIRVADLSAIYTFAQDNAVKIGRLTQNEIIPAMISISDLLSCHFAVIGSTGVGKTTGVALLLHRSLEMRPNLRVMILDPHNEYRKHFPELSVVFNVDTLELPFWMFKFDEIADIIYAGRVATSEEKAVLFELIKAAKVRYATAGNQAGSSSSLRRNIQIEAPVITADTPIPYRLIDTMQILDDWAGQLDLRFERSTIRSLRHRIESLSRDQRYRFMFGKVMVEDNMTSVLSRLYRAPMQGKPVTIVQLAGLPNEVVNSVVSVLARLAFDMTLWNDPGQYEILLVCEEAHRYIPTSKSMDFAPTRQAIGRIAKEGRKYGCSLAVISQRPAELDPTVLSQCSTMFAMRLANEADKTIIRSAIAESAASTLSFLSSIANREAIAFGEAIPTPMRMKFDDADWQIQRETGQDGNDRAARPFDLNRVISGMRGECSSEM